MPSVSKKQHSFMAAVAKNPAFAKKVGVPRSVGEEFLTADKGKKFMKGGEMKAKKMAYGGTAKKMAMGGTAMGKVKTAAPSRDGVAVKGKTKGKMVKMAAGGMHKGKKAC